MRYYLECPYRDKDEVKALGAKWDPYRKKWYYMSEHDRPKFTKWIVEEIVKRLPDLSSEINSEVQEGKYKFFLRMGLRGTFIIKESLSKDGTVMCHQYYVRKVWNCFDCSQIDKKLNLLRSNERCKKMSAERMKQYEKSILYKCREVLGSHDRCEFCYSYEGNIQQYIRNPNTVCARNTYIVYLGQFSSVEECRSRLIEYQIYHPYDSNLP